MALMPSIMSLFSSAPAQQGPAPATPVVQQQQTMAAAANPSVPSVATPQSTGSTTAIPAAGQGDASPLANFGDLWKADPNANQQTPSTNPAFNLDHKQLWDASQKINFTQHIPEDLMTKAMSGDRAAFGEVLNKVAQFGFANAASASGELVKQSLGSAQTSLEQTILPNALRNQEVSRALDQANPIFADPAVAPMLGMLKQQLQTKYPTASPEQIAKTATEYLTGMSQKITGVAPGQPQQTRSGYQQPVEQDWGKYFEI